MVPGVNLLSAHARRHHKWSGSMCRTAFPPAGTALAKPIFMLIVSVRAKALMSRFGDLQIYRMGACPNDRPADSALRFHEFPASGNLAAHELVILY